MEKILIFDASPLISFSMNGLLPELKKLKEKFNGRFMITQEVKYEIVERPITIKRFELEALKLQELIDEKILEFPSILGIDEKKISEKTIELMETANKTFFEKGKPLHLIDSGETSALVLSKMLNERNIENIIVVDERTTRLLCEKPENLQKLLQKKLHSPIEIKDENLKYFKNFKFVRSCEIAYMMYKKGVTKTKNKQVLDAMLYALKFKGCAVSTEEISKLKKIA